MMHPSLRDGMADAHGHVGAAHSPACCLRSTRAPHVFQSSANGMPEDFIYNPATYVCPRWRCPEAFATPDSAASLSLWKVIWSAEYKLAVWAHLVIDFHSSSCSSSSSSLTKRPV